MKRHDDINDYTELRENEVYSAFLLIMAEWEGDFDMRKIYMSVSRYPTSRFFVSLRRAVKVIRLMQHTDIIMSMSQTRQRMYLEIERRVKRLLPEGFVIPQDADMPRNGNCKENKIFHNAVAEVIRQPAPEMYLEDKYIRKIIKRKHKEAAATRLAYFKERQRRLSFCCTKINNK